MLCEGAVIKFFSPQTARGHAACSRSASTGRGSRATSLGCMHEALPADILEQGVLLRLHLHSLVRYAVTCRVAFRHHAVASAAMEAGVVPPLPPAATVFNWLHFARCTRGIQRSALALGEGSTFVVDASGGLLAAGGGVDYNLIRDNDAVDYRRLPTRINALGCVCCVAACAGDEHSAILTDTDDLFTFGHNGEGQGATGDLSGSSLPRRTRAAAPGDRDPGRLRVQVFVKDDYPHGHRVKVMVWTGRARMGKLLS